MDRYNKQMSGLAAVLEDMKSPVLNIYDIDGTLAKYMRGSKCMNLSDDIPALVRKPMRPYILLSARSMENMRKTTLWCEKYDLKPLCIFHRYTDIWSFENSSIIRYKPDILHRLNLEMPFIKMTVYDDDEIPFMRNLDDIHFVTLARI